MTMDEPGPIDEKTKLQAEFDQASALIEKWGLHDPDGENNSSTSYDIINAETGKTIVVSSFWNGEPQSPKTLTPTSPDISERLAAIKAAAESVSQTERNLLRDISYGEGLSALPNRSEGSAVIWGQPDTSKRYLLFKDPESGEKWVFAQFKYPVPKDVQNPWENQWRINLPLQGEDPSIQGKDPSIIERFNRDDGSRLAVSGAATRRRVLVEALKAVGSGNLEVLGSTKTPSFIPPGIK